jgi:hypothetical protein
MSRNILEFVLCERLANIKAVISDLTAVKEKKHADAASEVARVKAAKRELRKTRRITSRKATSVVLSPLWLLLQLRLHARPHRRHEMRMRFPRPGNA